EVEPAILLADAVARRPGSPGAPVLDAPRAVLLPPHVLAEVAEEEGRHARRVEGQLALADRQRHPGQRAPPRAGARPLAVRRPRQLPRLGLPVAVAALQAGGLP